MKFFKLQANKILVISFLLIYLIGYAAVFLSPNVEVSYVYKVCPVFTIYVENIDNTNPAGINKGIFNFIRHIDRDSDVEDHELIHAKQCYRTFYLSTIYAYFNKTYLTKCEAEAYAPMINSEHGITPFAEMIRDCYGPDVPIEKIEGYLRNYL